jgi:signal peptidase I
VSNTKSDARLIDETRRFVKDTQGRLKRTKRVPDDARSQIETQLNELRQAMRDADSDEIDERRESIEKLVAKYVEPNEKSAWREYAESIGIAVILALFLRGFVVEAFKIPTGSMIPTLLVGDHLFVNKFIFGIRIPFTQHYVTHFEEPARGDVVVFTFPADEAKEYLATQSPAKRTCIDQQSLESEKDMIKRIVGTEGDTIEVKKNQLIVNGEPVKRTFLRKEVTGNYMHPYEILERETLPNGDSYTVRFRGGGHEFGPVKVKPDHVFVMGDNRDNSSDGRCWGQVPKENIKGRAIVIWWSVGPDGIRWERFGKAIE